MKADIHPKYHEIKVVMTDGTEYTTKSCYGKPGDVIRLDIDPLNHPAWTGGATRILEKGRMEKFGNRYAGFGIASTEGLAEEKPAEEKAAESKEETK